MADSIASVREWRNVDLAVFNNEIVPRKQPAVLRSLVRDWPAVVEGLRSPGHVCRYIKSFDQRQPVDAIVGAPSIEGRFFYQEDLKGFNFRRKRVTVGTALDNLVALLDEPAPPAIALQAFPVADVLPGFERENVLGLPGKAVPPRMWLGNNATIAAHFDINSNLACVVAGRRKFTLFPPDQVANLYIGPLLATPGGTPISMADLHRIDSSRYPRIAQALEVRQEANLEPGDAMYIPILWWHAVESLDRLNVLVNYWWNDAGADADSPYDSLLHSMLSISRLPPDQRESWRAFFDYFVFQTDQDPAAHLPDDLEDILACLGPEKRQQLKTWLARKMLPPAPPVVRP